MCFAANIFCLCVIGTIFLREKWQIASFNCQEVIKIWKQTWWSNDKTINELSYRKISWFVGVRRSIICLSLRLRLQQIIDLLATDKSLYFAITEFNNSYYYSFKIFSRFWLVKTTRIIHHNQVLFTKFGKHLRHIESMTSKVERMENYWTNDVKMTSKVQPAADY